MFCCKGNCKKSLTLCFFLFCLLIFFVCLHIASNDILSGEKVFSTFSFLIPFSYEVTRSFFAQPLLYMTSGILCLLSFCVLILVSLLFKKEKKGFACFLFGIIFASIGQLLFLNYEKNLFSFDYQIEAGVTSYIISILFFLFSKNLNIDTELKEKQSRFNNFIFCFFIFLLLIFNVFTRYYALNEIPGRYEGELSPYHVGATTLLGIVRANYSFVGPFAPLGLLFYVPIYICSHFAFPSIVAVRASSILIYLITCFCLYVFVKKFSNKYIALLSVGFLTFEELQLGWSRTDFHPHGVTSYISILILYFIYRFFETSKKIYFIPLIFLMFISWQQYPSGQFAALIPIVISFFLILKRIFTKEKFGKDFLPFFILSLVGVFLWILNLYLYSYISTNEFTPYVYLNRLGGRVSFNDLIKEHGFFLALWETFKSAFFSFIDIVYGFYIKQKEIFFQDLFAPIGDINIRAISWFTAIFFTTGFFAFVKKFFSTKSILIFSYLIVACISGIMSDHIYVKRYSSIFPIVYFVASYGVFILINNLFLFFNKNIIKTFLIFVSLSSIFYIFFISNQLWFREGDSKNGQIAEEILRKKLKDEVNGNTLIVLCGSSHYSYGREYYLWSNEIRRGNFLFSFDCPSSLEKDNLKQYLQEQIQNAKQTSQYNWANVKNTDFSLENTDNVFLMYDVFKDKKQEYLPMIQKYSSMFSDNSIFFDEARENFEMGITLIKINDQYFK